ncbi:hypothetical protein AVEN_206870-1 [Araneus ventricosus]|uniref:Uncharacterized protein n=1 Tax=Araneus ventricosus TaxID=182803 RepID=A0A4Y2I0D1_ARAVE|nr:hypothetical protein AVEN_206870-1 [Araneus ventricosus]
MTAAAIASSSETGVLVGHHRATALHLPKEVHTITGGGTQSPTITIPLGKRLPAYLPDSKSYPCARGAPPPREHTDRLTSWQTHSQKLHLNVEIRWVKPALGWFPSYLFHFNILDHPKRSLCSFGDGDRYFFLL